MAGIKHGTYLTAMSSFVQHTHIYSPKHLLFFLLPCPVTTSAKIWGGWYFNCLLDIDLDAKHDKHLLSEKKGDMQTKATSKEQTRTITIWLTQRTIQLVSCPRVSIEYNCISHHSVSYLWSSFQEHFYQSNI